MSRATDPERAEMAAEDRVERSKRIRRQMDDVTRFWLEGLTVTLMARRLGTSKHRVYWLLRALELRDTKPPRSGWHEGHLYRLRVPPVDGASSGA